MKGYRHVEEKDRRRIAKLRSYRLGISEIARRTGFDKSTISREIRRNGHLELGSFKPPFQQDPRHGWVYQRKYAERRAEERRSKSNCRVKITAKSRSWATQKLKEGWSPELIAGRSGVDGPQSMSHEFIYKMIIADKKNGGRLYRHLKRFGKRKQRLGTRQYLKQPIPNRVPISERPPIVEKRLRLGDLEGDLIFGYKQEGYVLTLVDRKSRLVALELLHKKTKSEVQQGFLNAIAKMPAAKTLTLDNAREFSCHVSLTQKTGIKVYFADPYASYQRGSVENMNGLVREYLPKGTSFKKLTTTRLKEIEMSLNTRPKKILNYRTALEVAQNSVALRS